MAAAETSVLAGLIDGVILVVREGVAKKANIQKTIDTLGEDNIIGIVYNDQTENLLNREDIKKYGYYRDAQ